MKELKEIMEEIEARKDLHKERLNGASADETIYNLAAIDMANSIQDVIKGYIKSEDNLSIQTEDDRYFTDSEYRILLAAIDRESKVCRENDEANKDYRLSRIITAIRRKIRRVQYEKIWVPYQKNDGWFPVELSMPKEYPSIFAKFKGTSKWKKGMFEKVSKEVNVTLENDEGKAVTTHAHTYDGIWNCDLLRINPAYRVIAWKPLPYPFRPVRSEE